MRLGRPLTICAMFAALPCAVEARTWYITPDGLGDAPTIQAGIQAAAPRDTVLVACGTYYEHEILLAPQIVLRSELDDAACARIDAQGLGRAFVCIAASPTTHIEGFTITGGQGLAGAPNGGGGVHCQDSSLRLARCLVADNASEFGAGVGCYDSDLVLEDCRFEGNEAASSDWAAGGGLFCKDSSPILTGCTFELNSAFSGQLPGDGGGIFSQACFMEATDCVFERNSSGAGGGGFYSYSTDQPKLTRCHFIGNESVAGGGMYMETSYGSLFDCDFTENVATTGGGLFISQWSYPELEDCFFGGNRSVPNSGGGIAIWHSGPLIQRTRFEDNTSELDGGAVHSGGVSIASFLECVFVRNTAAFRGSAIRMQFAQRVDAIQCTIASNPSGPGGGAIYTELSGPLILDGTILAFHSTAPGVVCADQSPVIANCTDIYGNAGGDWIGCLAGQDGVNGNLSADPMFCDLDERHLGLKNRSPCAPPEARECGLIGALPVGCGAVSAPEDLESSSWGRIKAMWR
jgi:predicted outer membrane repeat protein